MIQNFGARGGQRVKLEIDGLGRSRNKRLPAPNPRNVSVEGSRTAHMRTTLPSPASEVGCGVPKVIVVLDGAHGDERGRKLLPVNEAGSLVGVGVADTDPAVDAQVHREGSRIVIARISATDVKQSPRSRNTRDDNVITTRYARSSARTTPSACLRRTAW